jgi:hypothetical protein
MQHHRPNRRLSSCALSMSSPVVLGLAGLLSACSADVRNMGENVDVETPPPYSRCLESATVLGDVTVHDQDELDQLDGCETIEGALTVLPFARADLRPLHALTSVQGLLSFSEPTPPSGWPILPSDGCYLACPEGFNPPGSSPFQEEYDTGWLESLAGLEALESVGGLKITGLAATSLAPLANLRALTDDGLLHLSYCPNLVDLNGLGNLTGIGDLYVTCDHLETLAPLSVSQQMNFVRISGPKLVDLGTLAVRRVSGFVEITGTALGHLDSLSNLISVGGWIYIMRNPALQDMSGLDALVSAGGLDVANNAQLVRFPAFAALTQLNALAILYNATLSDLTLFHDSHYRQPIGSNLSVQPWYAYRAFNIEVGGNPELESFAMPFPWSDARLVRINDNPKLRELELHEIETVDLVSIFGNANLETVNLGSMARVDALEVFNNPRLPTADFAALSTFSSTITGNAP